MASTVRLPVLLAFALTAAACSPQQRAMNNELDGAVQANAASKTHIEWETSASHPTRIFAKWRLDRANADDVCASLLPRSPQELTLFENEINDKDNLTLVEPCLKTIRAKLDDYWNHVADRSKKASMNFRFKDLVETRDFSQGGYFTHMDLAPKRVLLTFDDGPHAQFTDEILRTLAQVNARAVFFHMGNNIRRNPEIVKHVAAGGHGIGSHSTTHACLAPTARCQKNNAGHMLTFQEAAAEISGAHRMLQKILGWVDPFFRFPYGDSSPELKQYVRERHVGEFFWSVDSNDWRKQEPEGVVRQVMSQLMRQNERGIILMHDIQRRTTIALPILLKELYFRGYTPVILRVADKDARKHNQL